MAHWEPREPLDSARAVRLGSSTTPVYQRKMELVLWMYGEKNASEYGMIAVVKFQNKTVRVRKGACNVWKSYQKRDNEAETS